MSNRGRRTSTARKSSSAPRGKRKNAAEAKVEMITWFLLVGIFGAIYMLPDDNTLPNWLVPALGGGVLIFSGVYQYVRGWRVSPVTWIIGVGMIGMALWGFYYAPNYDMIGLSLLAFAVVIGMGVLTGET